MKKVVTVCPYCASGCKINLVVDNGKIVRAEAAQGKTNQGTLCLKGYYGWDFIHTHAGRQRQRLEDPPFIFHKQRVLAGRR